MYIIYYLAVINLFIYRIYSQPTCSIQGTTPTSSCVICQDSANIMLLKQTSSPTPQTGNICPYCMRINTCDRANFCQFGADQTTSQMINIGQTTPLTASSMATSSKFIWQGNVLGFFYSECSDTSGYPGCFSTALYTGRPRCLCGTEETNVKTATPSLSGYYFPSTLAPASNDVFYPTAPGYWVFHFQCMGSGLTTDASINIRKTSDNSIIRTSSKSGSGVYSTLEISIGYTFDAVGGSGNGIYLECVNCEIGSNGYCSFMASRVA